MGSGCTSYNTSSIQFQKKTLDSNVQYTGAPYPILGICTGDTLAEVEQSILLAITNFESGIGISIPGIDLTTQPCAPLFASCISGCDSCTDLPCLLKCYKTALCTLFSDVTTLQTEVSGFESGYVAPCLDGITTSSTVDVVLQKLINEFCALLAAFNILSTTVGGFTAGINTTIGNFLLSAINSCGSGSDSVVKTGIGASANIQILGTCPIGTIMMFDGSNGRTAWFDSSGRGYSTSPACGWAYANGQNDTLDMRNQTPIGVTNMAGTSGLKSNAGLTSYIMGAIYGQETVSLSSANNGMHTHSLTIDFSTVNVGPWYAAERKTAGTFVDGNSMAHSYPQSNTDPTPFFWHPTGTPIVNMGTSGLGTPHENRQPTTAVFYIQRIS